MKCCACHAPIAPGHAKCSICGFPVIQSTGSDENELDHLKTLGHTYLQNKLKHVTIGVTTYQYQMTNGQLSLKSESGRNLFEASKAGKIDGILWCDENFARVDTKDVYKKVHLNIFVDNGRIIHTPVLIKLPNIKGFCHIGFVLRDGLHAQMLMGDADTYTLSEQFSLI